MILFISGWILEQQPIHRKKAENRPPMRCVSLEKFYKECCMSTKFYNTNEPINSLKIGGANVLDSEGVLHNCEKMIFENAARVADKENPVNIFRDPDDGGWNLQIGHQFVQSITCCPFCSEKFND